MNISLSVKIYLTETIGLDNEEITKSKFRINREVKFAQKTKKIRTAVILSINTFPQSLLFVA